MISTKTISKHCTLTRELESKLRDHPFQLVYFGCLLVFVHDRFVLDLSRPICVPHRRQCFVQIVVGRTDASYHQSYTVAAQGICNGRTSVCYDVTGRNGRIYLSVYASGCCLDRE